VSGSLEPVLHPLLSSRWSPTTFDTEHELSDAEVEVLLEAARWAPSAGNSQPWAFIVGRRGDPVQQRLASHLARSSAVWAATASGTAPTSVDSSGGVVRPR